jgi:hypothetical protein
MTPYRELPEDGVEGRGYYLWGDKGLYTNTLNRPVIYSYSWSRDFSIQSEP